MNKLFLVGSPRSGTTLLQTILSHERALFTLKETHFFRHLHRWRPLRPLDRLWLDPARVEHAFGFIAAHNQLEAPRGLARLCTLAQACAAFDQLLSEEAAARGVAGWLEKTPEHAFFTGEIRRHVPGARFVHILRDGADVVASLFDARQKYPESWGWLGELESMVRLYNRYVRVIARERGKADTFVMLYDDLIEKNPAALGALARFVGAGRLDLERIGSYRDELVRPDEAWKIREDTGVVDTRGQKFKQLFPPAEQRRILAGLTPIDAISSG